MNFDALAFVVTVILSCGSALITIIVRDATIKNTLKNKVEALAIENATLKTIDNKQDAEIKRNEQEILTLRERQVALRERFEEFQKIQSVELDRLNETMNKLAQSFASVDATLKGVQVWLKRVDEKLDNPRKR